MAGNLRQNPPQQPQFLPRSHSTTAPRLHQTTSCGASTPNPPVRSKSTTKSRSKSAHTKADNRSSYNNDSKPNSITNPRSSPRPTIIGGTQPYPSAWSLSPGRLPPTEPTKEIKKKPSINDGVQSYPSAWALSPGRLPPAEQTKEKKKGVMGFLNINSRKKAREPSEREEAAHRMRIMACRLLQWRFMNARRERVLGRVRSAAERKICFAWLRINQLRNIVAADRILIQRGKQKLKLARILNPQLHLLNQWDPLSKRHLDSVAGLSTALESVCFPVPLINGAKADIDLLHDYISISMEFMAEIEDALRIFYSKVEEASTILNELVKILRLEIDSLKELMKMGKTLATLEMHETSLRANLIQATKKEP